MNSSVRKPHPDPPYWLKAAAMLLLTPFFLVGTDTQPATSRTSLELLVCPPTPGNVRNTEASVVELKDGRLLLAYTRFSGCSMRALASVTVRGVEPGSLCSPRTRSSNGCWR